MSVILLVDDNPHIMKINTELFTMHGYEVIRASSVSECLRALEWHPVNLAVLDIMLPDGSGVDLCRKIKEKYNIPILFLSALGESKDVVEGLRAGGDDYLAKPYDFEELLARVEARLRREKDGDRYVRYGKLKLDTRSATGYLNGVDLVLTQKEFFVLLLLAQNAGRVVSKQEILREIWNTDAQSDVRALWTLISRLRAKIETGNSHLTISSERKSGYMLEEN